MTLTFDHVSLNWCYAILHHADSTVLKAFVHAARAQSLRHPDSETIDRLDEMTTEIISPFLFRMSKQFDKPVTWIYNIIRELVESQTLSGLVLNICYSIPLSENEVERIRDDSFMNEISMCETERRRQCVNWAVLLYPEYHHLPLIESAEPQPTLNTNIRNVLHAFKADYKGAMIYPFASKKGVSIETSEDFWFSTRAWDVNHLPFKQVTPYQLLERFLQTGERTLGSAEMRQKWYPTGLKPRTYFAQGGTAFFASTYLRGFLNELADRFIPTNRFSRVDVSRLKLSDPTGRFVIYDFSNFTSNFSEQYYFLTELASFFRGCPVRLAGPFLEPIYADLGDLLDDYAEICNNLPEYWVGTSCCRDVSTSLAHMQAGFLGVFGNLMTCTVPHGLVVRQHVRSDEQQMTAGDDGVAEPVDEHSFQQSLDSLGDAAPEKHFTSDERSIVLKKPFHVNEDGCAVQTPRLDYPNLNFIKGQGEQMDPRFEHLIDLTFGERRVTVHTQLQRFIRELSTYELEEWEAGIIESFLKTAIRVMQLGDDHVNYNDRIRVHVPGGHRFVQPLPLLSWKDLSYTSDLRRYPYVGSTGLFRVFRRGKVHVPLEDGLQDGELFECNWSNKMKYLEMSGVIRRIVGKELEEFEDVFEYVHERDMDDYRETGPEVSMFKVVQSVEWLTLVDILDARGEAKTMMADAVSSFEEFVKDARGKEYINPFTGHVVYRDLDYVDSTEYILRYDEVESTVYSEDTSSYDYLYDDEEDIDIMEDIDYSAAYHKFSI